MAGQLAFASDVAAVNAQSKVLEQSVVEASEETAIPDFVTTRIFVVIMNGDIFAATHGKRTEASLRLGSRHRRDHIFAGDIFVLDRRRIRLREWAAIWIRRFANLVHATLQ